MIQFCWLSEHVPDNSLSAVWFWYMPENKKQLLIYIYTLLLEEEHSKLVPSFMLSHIPYLSYFVYQCESYNLLLNPWRFFKLCTGCRHTPGLLFVYLQRIDTLMLCQFSGSLCELAMNFN